MSKLTFRVKDTPDTTYNFIRTSNVVFGKSIILLYRYGIVEEKIIGTGHCSFTKKEVVENLFSGLWEIV